jgi:hypothetical protein
VWSVTTIIARLSSSTSPSASSSPRPSSPTSSSLQVTYPELQAGDCLQGPGLNLGTSDPWPDYFNVVSCTQQHIAEVFFADNAWPSSRAYPGDNELASQADARCKIAFHTYDGIYNSQSVFSYDYASPDSISWADGDRWVVCIAYRYPGGAPVNYSIKGSRQ